jgi:hypothetical protein
MRASRIRKKSKKFHEGRDLLPAPPKKKRGAKGERKKRLKTSDVRRNG